MKIKTTFTKFRKRLAPLQLGIAGFAIWTYSAFRINTTIGFITLGSALLLLDVGSKP